MAVVPRDRLADHQAGRPTVEPIASPRYHGGRLFGWLVLTKAVKPPTVTPKLLPHELPAGMVVFDRVTKRVSTGGGRSVVVLDDVSITIEPGTRLAVYAPTLDNSRAFLNCLAGHEQVTSGEILVGGTSSWSIGSRMPLTPVLTGRANAEFLISIYGSLDDDGKEMEFIEKLCDLGDLFDEPIEAYTSGMRDRFKLAVSLAFQFEVYPVQRWEGWNCRAAVPFMEQVKRLVDRRLLGRTLIAEASHSQNFAVDYCDEGIVLKDGKIVFKGDLAECNKIALEERTARKDRSLSRSIRQHSDLQGEIEESMNELVDYRQYDNGGDVSSDDGFGDQKDVRGLMR
ncbi:MULTISPECIES: hypothetical protein [Aphanothece]|uniref:hypothetical protein n=1 Tax=Aphanothece TaxID=1121 RepID=UPI003984C85B